MKNFTLNKQVATLVLCGIATLASAKSLYVSPEGNDSNDGLTSTTAVKTLSKAFTLAERNDAVLISGFLDMTQEPTTDLYGKGYYNLKGNQGVKVPTFSLSVTGEDKETSGFDAKSTVNAGTCCLRVDGCAEGVIFKNLTFKNGDPRGDKGGSAYIRSGIVTFEDCNFFNNRNLTLNAGNGRGGAIYYEANNENHKLIMNRCTFKDNHNKEGGDIFVQSGTFEANWCNFEGSDISDFSGSEGGVLKTTTEGNLPDVNITFNNCVIKNYIVHGNAGVFCLKHNKDAVNLNFTVNSCAIMENKCVTYQGGAVLLENTKTGSTDHITFVNTLFFYNQAPNGTAGAIYIQKTMENSSFDLINCTLLGNEAKSHGGIRIDNSGKNITKHIYNCIFEENIQNNNGNITENDLSVQYNDVSETDLIIKNSFIKNEDTGNNNISNSTANYAADNTINYTEGVLVPSSEADTYANTYNCIPLAENSAAATYGDAQYLTALNITTDQIGKSRDYSNGTCAAGSVEAPASEIEDIVNSNPEEQVSDNIKIACNGNTVTISSTDKIIKINVYAQNGGLLKSRNGRSAQEKVVLPANNIYIISVQTEGKIVNQKVCIP